ncbi:trypsin-1-like [Bacillus rossius redtenbacheri]|uniref:trypsin-1-like n=1 Tax=Bacillus rossius redtenbacheri TaxID=93214 RepID=UPI002FDE8AB9
MVDVGAVLLIACAAALVRGDGVAQDTRGAWGRVPRTAARQQEQSAAGRVPSPPFASQLKDKPPAADKAKNEQDLPSSGVVEISPLIVNGTAASAGEYPYVVSIQKFGIHYCAGTIVNEDWILTAAHCVDDELASDLVVVAGSVRLSQGGVARGVDYYLKHSRFNASNAYENDIAVIKLASPLAMSASVRTVALPAAVQHTPGGVVATVVGWGLLYTDGPTSDLLQKVDLVTFSDAACQEALSGYPHAHNLCAGWPSGGKGHCSGDSGGPLLVSGVQVGIVSWSVKPCASQGYPGVYIETSFFASWIRRHTQD